MPIDQLRYSAAESSGTFPLSRMAMHHDPMPWRQPKPWVSSINDLDDGAEPDLSESADHTQLVEDAPEAEKWAAGAPGVQPGGVQGAVMVRIKDLAKDASTRGRSTAGFDKECWHGTVKGVPILL